VSGSLVEQVGAAARHRAAKDLDRAPGETVLHAIALTGPMRLHIQSLVPWLYLKGVSTGGFSDALAALLGLDAKGLSATTVMRLKAVWEDEYKAWSGRFQAAGKLLYVARIVAVRRPLGHVDPNRIADGPLKTKEQLT
jgi:hypothetical protein